MYSISGYGTMIRDRTRMEAYLRALRQATRRMAAGHLDTRLTVQGSDELAELSAAFNETAVELERSVSELRRMEAQARRFSAGEEAEPAGDEDPELEDDTGAGPDTDQIGALS